MCEKHGNLNFLIRNTKFFDRNPKFWIKTLDFSFEVLGISKICDNRIPYCYRKLGSVLILKLNN